MGTIPNLVTVSGILATLIYVAGYLTGHVYLAMGAAAWTMLSDFLDGKLARLLCQETVLGAVLDPISDRLFLVAALGNLVYLYGVHAMLNVWVAAIIAAEGGILIAYVLIRASISKIIKVSFVGKIRQVGHLALIGIAITDGYFHVGETIPVPTLGTIFTCMAVLSATALFFYLGRAFTIWQQSKSFLQ